MLVKREDGGDAAGTMSQRSGVIIALHVSLLQWFWFAINRDIDRCVVRLKS